MAPSPRRTQKKPPPWRGQPVQLAGTLLSGGLLLCMGLEAVEEIHGALRVGGGGEDRPLVLPEDFE